MELERCPFCGGEAIFVPHSGCSGQIACIGGCHFESGVYWDDPMTSEPEQRRSWKEIVAEKWNKRV